MAAGTAAATAAGRAARHHTAAAAGLTANGGENGDGPPRVRRMAPGALDGGVKLAHGPQGLEPLVARLALVLVNGHGNLETVAN